MSMMKMPIATGLMLGAPTFAQDAATGVSDAGIIIHDPANKVVAHMLIDMPFGAFPMALGVIFNDPRPTFESAVRAQNAELSAGKAPDLQALVSKGQTWQVTKEPRSI